MRRCEDEKMFYRPPLLEEPCAQTLSGKMIVATFSSCFLLLLLLLLLRLLLRWQAATPKIEPLPAAYPHGSEGRKSIKIAPKICLM